MSRRCDCRWVLDALDTDPRLRMVPLAAQMLWVRLVRALVQLPEPGVFMLGSRVGSLREIALLVSAEVTEVETHLEPLVETGLLSRRDDGALMIPDTAPGGGRAAVSRKNGGLGGRPRRGETPEQARLRRQQPSLLLAIDGAAEASAETQGNPAGNLTRERAAAACLEDTEEKQSKPREETLTALGNELVELARLDPASGAFTYRPIGDWIAQGATPALLREVIGAVAARPGYQPPRGFGYFAGAVTDAMKRPLTPPLDPDREACARRFNQARQLWADHGMVGPAPRYEAFQASAA